jgi:hypothetical protein
MNDVSDITNDPTGFGQGQAVQQSSNMAKGFAA